MPAIVGATSSTYTVQPGDVGWTIWCEVTLANGEPPDAVADSNSIPIAVAPGGTGTLTGVAGLAAAGRARKRNSGSIGAVASLTADGLVGGPVVLPWSDPSTVQTNPSSGLGQAPLGTSPLGGGA